MGQALGLKYDVQYVSNTFRYTSNMAKKAKRMRAYRLTDETIFEIERLASEWQSTQADVIERAVRSASQMPVANTARASELKVEYDES